MPTEEARGGASRAGRERETAACREKRTSARGGRRDRSCDLEWRAFHVRFGVAAQSLDSIVALSRPGAQIRLSKVTLAAVRRSRAVVEAAVQGGGSVYGVNTGFGKLSNVSIETDQLGTLQRNLILSHATGVGASLPIATSSWPWLSASTISRGGSPGVRPELLQTMIAFFNASYIPVIPSQGSVGASGDLAPLAHMALPLLGHGELHRGHGGTRVKARSFRAKRFLRNWHCD